MYQNCCKKCGSIDLHTEVKDSNTGLYCNDCGAFQKWLGKDELRAFEYAMRNATKQGQKSVNNISEPLFTKEQLKQFYQELEKKSFKVVKIDLGYTETDAVRLVDVEDILVNQFK